MRTHVLDGDMLGMGRGACFSTSCCSQVALQKLVFAPVPSSPSPCFSMTSLDLGLELCRPASSMMIRTRMKHRGPCSAEMAECRLPPLGTGRRASALMDDSGVGIYA